jgi:hypothetical protein
MTGVVIGGLALAIEALAVLPGRVAVGRHLAAFGQSAWGFSIAGMFRDVSDVARPVGLALSVLLAIALFVRRGKSEVQRRVLRVLVPALSIVGIVLWFTSSSAAEFKLQRGVDATWFDVEIASRATNQGNTILGFLGCRRHFIPGILAFLAASGLLFAVRKRARGWEMNSRAAVLGGFVGMTILGSGLVLIPLDPHVRLFAIDRHIVGEPFVDLFGSGFDRSQENVRLGMRALIETASFPPSATGGEAILGIPTVGAAPVDCTAHPFARAFEDAGVEPARLGTTGHHELEPEAARAMVLFDKLSRALYTDRKAPIDVWQVMLESFRADDIHAITPSAPRAIAPFMNGLYEAAGRGESVIAVKSMWQAGSRSSQGLSAYECGLGTMPYGLSTTRDFGAIPLRCLTDILVDAKFQTAFFYGGNPSFDMMDPFLRHHGVTNIVGHQQFPVDAPVGQEGITDRAVYARAARDMLKTAPDAARYTLVMSASNHVPYNRPEDVSPEIEAAASGLKAAPEFVGSPDDYSRIRTFAYADKALADLVDQLKPRADRTIFVFGADHATGDPFIWKNDARNAQAATARIPFTIVLPDALVASSKDPEAVRALVRELNAALDGHAWSQNDVPMFVLTLLGRGPAMRAIPAERRWHTFGGERTSPYFRALSPAAKIVGIDAIAELYGENDAEQSLLPPEKASFVSKPSEITTSSPSLIPVAATMQSYLRGYVAKCGSDKKRARKAREPKPSDPPITERDHDDDSND